MQQGMTEIAPLGANDCFTIYSKTKKQFEFQLHRHDEYELNLIMNAKGAKRIVGDHIEIIDDLELVFIGPSLHHAWITHQCKSEAITEVTIRFHKDLIGEKLLKRHQFSFIKKMLENAESGIFFSKENIQGVVSRILNLKGKSGLGSVLELFSILHDLSVSRDMKILSDSTFFKEKFSHSNKRMARVVEYMHENYHKQITLAEVSEITNMPMASFSRFIKKNTGKTFVETVNEIRLGHASKMLINTNFNVAEIAYKCGFNNISNFNRIFKRKKLCIPKDFRETYKHTIVPHRKQWMD